MVARTGRPASKGPRDAESTASTTLMKELSPPPKGDTHLSPSSDAPDLFVGRVLSHYRLEERLGAGGMGVLYRAVDLNLGRAVAIKLLARHLVSDETAKARFVREARAASALDHPNIANIYEIGEADGELFIAMALYEGQTLKQRLEKGRLAVEEALGILRQVLLGLEAAHGAGVIHRDIKPANILVTSKGTVKILDFGLAKLVSESQAETMTQAGQAMGTVLYMSPEQLRGEAVDSRTDLWSFGVLAYQLLAGTSPFQTDSNAATVARILNDEPSSLAAVPGIPDWLAQLVSELLRKNPADRPQTASEVLPRFGGNELARTLPAQPSAGSATSAPVSSGGAEVPTESASLANWFAELKRRRVFRALVGYGIAAFAVLQVIEPIMHGAHWPESVLSYVVAALAAGFPIVVTLAWIFDVKSGRIERTAPAAAATGLRGIPLALMLAAIGVLAAAPGPFYYFVLRGRSAKTSGPADNVASVAILPFASLSTGEENAYFAEGFHDELLRQMGGVGDLQVISRTSVMQYKNGARNSREIAEALGVSSIVEGSVQRAGNRVRVEARLIDARNDRQLWGERYDRELIDVFAIQTALAEEIARALNARLSRAEKTRLERKPTGSAEAYDYYLRGREYDLRPGRQPRALRSAEQMYRKAIELDPSFAVARARLANLHAIMYWFAVDSSPARLAEANNEADRAVALQADLAEARVAKGWVHYVQRDYDSALKEYKLAHDIAPSDVLVLMSLGFVERRRGRFEEAYRYIQQGVTLDPHSTNNMDELGNTLFMQRRYREALNAYDRALAWSPDYVASAVNKARVQLIWKGDAGPAKAIIAKFPAGSDPDGKLTDEKYLLELFKTFPVEAWATLSPLPLKTVTTKFEVVPKVLLGATAAEAQGDRASARSLYESARTQLEPEVHEHPDDFRYRAPLGRAYAGLGRKQDAIREGERAVELLPISRDAFDGSTILEDLGGIYAQVGELDRALEIIEKLLSIPSYFSPVLLRLDPKWAPLRDHPRFRKLAQLENE